MIVTSQHESIVESVVYSYATAVMQFQMVYVLSVEKGKSMMTDTIFIQSKARINFHVRNKKVRAIPVNKYFVITAGYSGYKLYNRTLCTPVLEREFETAKLAYEFGKTLEHVYGDYLDILDDKKWTEHFFIVMRLTVPLGMKMFIGMNKLLGSDDLITQDTLEKAFNVTPR